MDFLPSTLSDSFFATEAWLSCNMNVKNLKIKIDLFFDQLFFIIVRII